MSIVSRAIPLPPFGRLDVVEGAHVVKPIRQFHQQNADVSRSRKQELPEIFRLTPISRHLFE